MENIDGFSKFERLNLHLWFKFPIRVLSKFRINKGLIYDGLYLTAINKWFYLLAPINLIIGILIGAFHFGFSKDLIYTSSLSIIFIFIILSFWGSLWGMWLCIGYGIGDIIIRTFAYTRNPLDNIEFIIAKFFPFYLLWILCALFPSIVNYIVNLLAKRLNKYIKVVLGGVVFSSLTFMWINITPTLIRPIYTWRGRNPTINVIEPLQEYGLIIVFIAFAVGCVRIFLEEWSIARYDMKINKLYRYLYEAVPETKSNVILKITSFSIFSTLLLSGIINGIFQFCFTLLTFTCIYGLIFLKSKKWHGYISLLSKIHIIFRIIIGIIISYFVTSMVIQAYWGTTTSFFPVLLSSLISCAILFLLTPDLILNKKKKL